MIPVFAPTLPLGTVDPDAAAWRAQVVTNGGTVTNVRLGVVSTFIKALKAAGVWTIFDRIWLLAAANTQSALVDLVARDVATAVNSPTFTTDRGYTGEDATNPSSYIDTTFNMGTAAKYLQNSAHLSAWSVTNNTPSAGGVVCGNDTGGGGTWSDIWLPYFGDGLIYASCNHPGTQPSTSNATMIGHWIINRDSSTSQDLFRNGSLHSAMDGSSGARQSLNSFILATNLGGTASYGTPQQIAMHSIGGSLTSGQVTSFYNALRAYMTAVGVP